MQAVESCWRSSLLALALALGACAPKIGDACTTSSDCSTAGDRLCDPTEPGGYCTIFNCEPDSCPSDSVCIAFQAKPSLASACADPQEASRFRRTFCMARCSSNGDCRSGYECADLNDADHPGAPNPWGAIVADTGRGNKACVVPFSGEPVNSDAGAQVCTGTDASFADVPVWSSDAGVGGAGGTSGAGGAGGAPAVGGGAGSGGTGTAGGAAGKSGVSGGGGTGG